MLLQILLLLLMSCLLEILRLLDVVQMRSLMRHNHAIVVHLHDLWLVALSHVDRLSNLHVVVRLLIIFDCLCLIVLRRVERILGQDLLPSHVQALEK